MGAKEGKKAEKKVPVMSIIAVGSTEKGQTALIKCYEQLLNKENNLNSRDNRTIVTGYSTIDYTIKEEQNKEIKLKIKIWDSISNERLKTIVFCAIKNVQGIFLVYDVANKKTFDDLSEWINGIKDYKDISTFPIIIIGNRINLEDKRQVTVEEAQKFAGIYQLPYFETSSLTGEGVKEAFSALIQKVYEQNKTFIKKKYQN